jgi:hypothetical protein
MCPGCAVAVGDNAIRLSVYPSTQPVMGRRDGLEW